MNGDYGPYNQPVQVMYAESRPGVVTVWAPSAHTGVCRVNYIVALAP